MTTFGPVVPATVNPKAVRAWAIANGYPQLAGKRGRLSQDVIDAYLEAHPESSPVMA